MKQSKTVFKIIISIFSLMIFSLSLSAMDESSVLEDIKQLEEWSNKRYSWNKHKLKLMDRYEKNVHQMLSQCRKEASNCHFDEQYIKMKFSFLLLELIDERSMEDYTRSLNQIARIKQDILRLGKPQYLLTEVNRLYSIVKNSRHIIEVNVTGFSEGFYALTPRFARIARYVVKHAPGQIEDLKYEIRKVQNSNRSQVEKQKIVAVLNSKITASVEVISQAKKYVELRN
ncbi:MAG: hypothetical protein VX642_00370 [Bdellovibrionota bacterium]|nr:hypothetical protein [Bdellovibrionota bacterium]